MKKLARLVRLPFSAALMLVELLLRPILRAPKIVYDFVEYEGMTGQCVMLPSDVQQALGVQAGDHVFVKSKVAKIVARVYDGDELQMTSAIIDVIGSADISVRRRLLPMLLSELYVLNWTLIGMAVVWLTLSGSVRNTVSVLLVISMVLHLLSLRLRVAPEGKYP